MDWYESTADPPKARSWGRFRRAVHLAVCQKLLSDPVLCAPKFRTRIQFRSPNESFVLLFSPSNYMANVYPITDHNRFYASEDRKGNPKEYFKFLISLADKLLRPGARVLDVGCATGEFLHYLQSVRPGLSMTGLDIDEEFLQKAHASVPEARFVSGDIQTRRALPDLRFDIVFMSGVNYLFADPALWLRNIVDLTEGTAYVFGVFNPEELDVRMMVSRPGCSELQPWNLISQESISAQLSRIRHRFIPWSLPIPIPRTHADPMRSWTIVDEGGYLVVNGMQLIHRFAALEIINSQGLTLHTP